MCNHRKGVGMDMRLLLEVHRHHQCQHKDTRGARRGIEEHLNALYVPEFLSAFIA